ncbi:hypothetical protein ANCCAN_13914, partial [Ancylostoma caninum]
MKYENHRLRNVGVSGYTRNDPVLMRTLLLFTASSFSINLDDLRLINGFGKSFISERESLLIRKRAHQKEQATRAELEDLRSMLESRNAEFRLMELRTEELEAELATARELSEMHEHLKAELEEARKQRDDVELMVTSLKERAEKAERALEEDRARLQEERTALEKSMEQRKEQEVLIPLISEPEMEKKVVVSDNLTSLIDLTSTTALEMTTSDELQQLRAEIAQLNNVNAQ